jgi:hypothetical protein
MEQPMVSVSVEPSQTSAVKKRRWGEVNYVCPIAGRAYEPQTQTNPTRLHIMAVLLHTYGAKSFRASEYKLLVSTILKDPVHRNYQPSKLASEHILSNLSLYVHNLDRLYRLSSRVPLYVRKNTLLTGTEPDALVTPEEFRRLINAEQQHR